MNKIPKAKYTNALIHESSPYLLQHAHNPVNWYPWNEQALTLARTADKPILLSIGYAACHWCHVMAHESFEDEQTAALMNGHFICIKVDREERPDIDQVYMTFVQMSSGGGGWPLNVFLTPAQQPFFGGTYFPPTDRFNLPSWRKVLVEVSRFYRQDKARLQQSIGLIEQAFVRNTTPDTLVREIDSSIFTQAVEKIATLYDPQYGGFGSAPKFPAVQVMDFLLRHYHRSGDTRQLNMVTHSLRQMACGGIYDHLGGGFARYSVDSSWLVPHFEKMLYDNAQLAGLYLETFLETSDPFFLKITGETLDFVSRELRSEDGGFYSSLDADSEGIEGKYYLWDRAEVKSLLAENYPVFADYYDISSGGNYEGKNILHIQTDLTSTASRFNISEARAAQVLNDCRLKLFQARSRRNSPALDYKIITSWNALMLSAYAKSYQVLQDEKYRQIIIDNINFLHTQLFKNGQLLHTYSKGLAKHPGFLDDYALLINALWDAYEALFDINYLEWAKELLDYVHAHFWDENAAGYFYTSAEHAALIQRMKDEHDQSWPSATAMMLLNNLRFYALSGHPHLWQRSEQVLRVCAHDMAINPYAYSSYLIALDFFLHKPKEIIIALPDQEPAQQFYQTIFNYFEPNKVVFQLTPDQHSSLFSTALFKDKYPLDGKATIYFCHNNICSKPVCTVEELKQTLLGDRFF
jgi:uncharacterized protein YyaL (SSP411 family)